VNVPEHQHNSHNSHTPTFYVAPTSAPSTGRTVPQTVTTSQEHTRAPLQGEETIMDPTDPSPEDNDEDSNEEQAATQETPERDTIAADGPRLVPMEGDMPDDDNNTPLPTKGNTMWVGRTPDSDLILIDNNRKIPPTSPLIHRRHAYIVNEDGVFVIYAHGQRMLTFINNIPLPTPTGGEGRDMGAPIVDGDELRFGGDEDLFQDYDRFRFLVEIPCRAIRRPRGPPVPTIE
jgi:hypothetical protein